MNTLPLLNEESLTKIRWQCRRGMLELDLLLLSFFDQCYIHLSQKNKNDFQHLLMSTDPELFEWCLGQSTPPKLFVEIVALIRKTSYRFE